MRKPHASWAHCYDFVYENSYGNLCGRFTDLTLATLKKLAPGPWRAGSSVRAWGVQRGNRCVGGYDFALPQRGSVPKPNVAPVPWGYVG
ncbi:MAG TPA: hypothetical protein VNZ64_10505 [Candidatus Acidoferrum sp.]|jgi:hypothetical protein|nr:hypothetical protein [Candidatus Acidoferrum sp.]